MSLEIRPITPEELAEFRRVSGTALIMQHGQNDGMQPEFTLAAFENGNLATTFGFWPLTMCLNGKDAPISGVTYVGTLPAYRRRGHLRQIMTAHFKNLYESGERAIAALYASRAAIYQRYGYGIVTTHQYYNFEPRYLQFTLPGQTTGSLREAKETEFGLLVDVYRRFRQDRTGYLHRGKIMWETGIFGNIPQNGSLNKVIYEENGQPLGYMIYVMAPPSGGGLSGSRLGIRDLSWLSFNAYRALWEHLANMDLIQEMSYRAPAGDPLPHLILEPRMLKATAGDGVLARLVNVKKALTQRGYQENGTLIFELADELCPWNTGKWKLEASPQGSRVSATRQSAQLTLPPSTLAMLLFNQITATEAARMSRLDAREPAALKEWDRVLQTMHKPGCVDNF